MGEMHEVGCRKCGGGGNWHIFTDGMGNFMAKHSCGHVSNFTVVSHPDVQAIELRFLV